MLLSGSFYPLETSRAGITCRRLDERTIGIPGQIIYQGSKWGLLDGRDYLPLHRHDISIRGGINRQFSRSGKRSLHNGYERNLCSWIPCKYSDILRRICHDGCSPSWTEEGIDDLENDIYQCKKLVFEVFGPHCPNRLQTFKSNLLVNLCDARSNFRRTVFGDASIFDKFNFHEKKL